MITGTTGSWTTGTAAIDDPERQPVFGASVDFYGSIINQVTYGSILHDDFSGTAWPSWLSYGTLGTAAVTRGNGSCLIQSNAVADRAYIVTGTEIGTRSPNSGLFVVRMKAAAAGTGNVLWPTDVWNYGSKPIPTTAHGLRPAYRIQSNVLTYWIGAATGSVACVQTDPHILQAAYDGTSLYANGYTGTFGSLVSGTGAYAFGSQAYILAGDVRTNAGLGTLNVSYLSIYKGTALSIGNLGSGYVAQLYGTDNAVTASAQSSAAAGTARIGPNLEWPQYGYLRTFTGSAQTGSTGRFPLSENGTFWGGDLFKYGDTAESVNDISADVLQLSGRIELEEAYGGYVPAGAVSGDMDIRLASGSKYSRLNSASPLYDIRKLNRAVTVNAGFQYDGSAQTLRQFTGLSSKVEVDSSAREASLYSLDKSELLRRKKISWPIMHNVPSDYVIRAALAECGIYTTPAVDNQTDFMCKFNNSTTSEQGDAASYDSSPSYTTGRWGDADGALSGYSVLYPCRRVSEEMGFVSFWMKVDDPAGTGIRFTSGAWSGLPYLSFRYFGDGTIGVKHVDTAGAITTILTYAVDLGADWNHVCFTWDSDAGNKIYLYLNGQVVATTTIPATAWFASTMNYTTVAPYPGIDQVSIGPHYRTALDIMGYYLAASDDEDYYIDPGMNTIEWLWIDDRDAWNLIKDICEAEGAKFYFDANGKAHFENRYHSLNPPHLTSQKTIAYDADAMGLSLVEDVGQVINKAVVVSNPMAKQSAQIVWSVDTLLEIPAPVLVSSAGSTISQYGTREWWLWFNDPAVDVDTSITGTSGTTQSYFRAAGWRPAVVGIPRLYKDATGFVTMAGTAYSKAIRVTATNAFRDNAAASDNVPVWIPRRVVIGSGGAIWGTTVPNPFFGIYGAPIMSAYSVGGTTIDRIRKVTEDAASIGSYGEHAVEVNNNFIQSEDYAEYVSQYLVMYNRDPRPNVENVEIMADPRLEIGDRVTLNDSSGATGVAHDFWLTGIDWNMSPAYTQKLKLRFAGVSNFFILDHATQGRLDYNIPAF